MSEAVMHLDGCHFFVWVYESEPEHWRVSIDERTGSNLAAHRRDDCERCAELQHGAEPVHEETTMRAEHDPKTTFVRVLEVVAEHVS